MWNHLKNKDKVNTSLTQGQNPILMHIIYVLSQRNEIPKEILNFTFDTDF